MKIAGRGQVTIPKDIRDRFGLGPEAEVEFRVVSGEIVLKKTPRYLSLAKRKGRCAESFKRLDYLSVDEYIEDIRSR